MYLVITCWLLSGCFVILLCFCILPLLTCLVIWWQFLCAISLYVLKFSLVLCIFYMPLVCGCQMFVIKSFKVLVYILNWWALKLKFKIKLKIKIKISFKLPYTFTFPQTFYGFDVIFYVLVSLKYWLCL